MGTTEFQTLSSPDQSLSLTICAAIGGGITGFTYHKAGKEIPLMRPYDADTDLSPLNFSNFALTPFSNRIGYGKLAFNGEVYDINTPFKSGDHPNHGDGWMLPWKIIEHSDHALTLEMTSESTPYKYTAQQVFTLNDDGLTIDIAITNHADIPLPYGTGHHAYFPKTDDTILTVNTLKVWESENMLPVRLVDAVDAFDFSKGKALHPHNLPSKAHGDSGAEYMDHCFQGWDQKATITWPSQGVGLNISADDIFKNFVIFIPSADNFFCAEPVTNITNGFNLMEQGVQNTGTIILNPDETLQARVSFTPFALG